MDAAGVTGVAAPFTDGAEALFPFNAPLELFDALFGAGGRPPAAGSVTPGGSCM